jgi:DNA-binding NarL/FixJ family response regulator
MARLKILFADDQIPDDQIPDEDVKRTLKKQHPAWTGGFINAHAAMRQAVKTLRGAGYDVTIARTYNDALELVKHSHFDVAIVDLGWFADDAVVSSQRESKGWDICAAIDEADKKSKSQSTLQIIYSNRFAEDAAISMQAADSGKLPVFKNYNEATHQALRACVKFIETYLTSRSPQEVFAIEAAKELQQIMINSLTASLEQQKRWSLLTLVFVAISISLVIAGIACAIFRNIPVGTVSAASSILTGIISKLLFNQLKRSQTILEKNQGIIKQQLKEAIERLYSTIPTQAASQTIRPEET